MGRWVCCARKEARQLAGCSGANTSPLCPQKSKAVHGRSWHGCISQLTWGWGGKAHPSCRSSSFSPQLVLEGAGLGLGEQVNHRAVLALHKDAQSKHQVCGDPPRLGLLLAAAA